MNAYLRDNLYNDILHFCTQCGSEVAAYQWNESCGEADYGDYYGFYFEAVKTEQPLQDTAYDCPKCQKRWQTPGRTNTGYILTCGHFMPMYAAFCGVCGQPSTNQS